MPLTENIPTATRMPGPAAPGKENSPPSKPAATTSASAPVTSSITTPPVRVFRRGRSQRRGRGRGRGRSQRRGRGRSQRRGRN